MLAKCSHTVGSLLRCSAVRLRSAKAHGLLADSGVQGVVIAFVQDVGVDLGIGQVLLLVEVRRSNAATVTAKSPGADSIAHLSRLLLLVLLIEQAGGALKHVLQVRGHVLVDGGAIKVASVDGLTAFLRIPGSGPQILLALPKASAVSLTCGVKVRLCRRLSAHQLIGCSAKIRPSDSGCGIGAGYTCALRFGQRGDKFASVFLEGPVGDGVGTGVDCIVPCQHLRRDGDRLR